MSRAEHRRLLAQFFEEGLPLLLWLGLRVTVFTRLGPQDWIRTVDLRMDFLRRCRPDEDLWCSAQVQTPS
jgi:hypothetical protein